MRRGYIHRLFLFGITTSGRNVNEFTAMQMTAVYSCVRLLVKALATSTCIQELELVLLLS